MLFWANNLKVKLYGHEDSFWLWRIFILARKGYSVILVLGFFLCLFGIVSTIAQAWQPPCVMSCNKQSRKWNELKVPHDCCDGISELLCIFFQGCFSKSFPLALSVVSEVKNRQYTDSAIQGNNVIPTTEFSITSSNMAETRVAGPSVSLFLKNLSLLC